MITERKSALRPILESSEGIHLTGYLENNGNLIELKSQLRQIVDEANECLLGVQNDDERKRFFAPINALLNDTRTLRAIRGNIGLFRTKDSFRILSLPIPVERQCHVATSFHVKPLLRWIQSDREFLLLGVTEDSAHLYQGSRTSLQKIDSVLFPEILKNRSLFGDYASLKRSRKIQVTKDETGVWLSEWLEEITQKAKPRLFLAGDADIVSRVINNLEYNNIVKNPVALWFGERRLPEICANIRRILVGEMRANLENSLVEFRFAEEFNLAQKNIFQIAKSAVRGRVRKLIVAEDIKVFGRINKKTGELVIHPFDLDHEDDDVLDDLAQAVLASGGEVIVAGKEEIPKGRPALAIVDPEGSGEATSRYFSDYEILKERIAK